MWDFFGPRQESANQISLEHSAEVRVDEDLEFLLKSISTNWMFEWLDELRDFEKIEFQRHTQQTFLSWFFHNDNDVGKGKAFVIKKIKELIQPSTVNFRALVNLSSSSISSTINLHHHHHHHHNHHHYYHHRHF
jgi:hypothetical protein